MRWLIPFTVAVLVLAACGAPSPSATTQDAAPQSAALEPVPMPRPAPSLEQERAGTHCQAGEAVAFSCAAGAVTASACVSADHVIFRQGALGALSLEIASTGADGVAHADTIIGGGGGQQQSVRFSHEGREYIAYAATRGELTDVAGSTVAGVVVLRGQTEEQRMDCPQAQSVQFSAGPVPAEQETDENYSAWW
ncbi:MAG: hypothetical protein ACT4OF_09400 [Caulobacteraceae bacterium]